MNQQTLSTCLAAIRGAGSVVGLVFSRGDKIIYHDILDGEGRASDVVNVVGDIAYYFEQNGRNPDQLLFGYKDGNLLLLLLGEFRMIVLHQTMEEVDAIARTCRSFLKDYAMGQLVLENQAQ